MSHPMNNFENWIKETLKKSKSWDGYTVLYKVPAPTVICTIENPVEKRVQFFGTITENAVVVARAGKITWCNTRIQCAECPIKASCTQNRVSTWSKKPEPITQEHTESIVKKVWRKKPAPEPVKKVWKKRSLDA